jgi:4-hydroxybenzoate polyprenyltransferase
VVDVNHDADGAQDGVSRPAWRSMLRGAAGLLGSAHLEPSLAVTLTASVLAYGAGLGGRAWMVALAVGSGQLSIGWSNDVVDWRRDRTAGRHDKPIARGRIQPHTVAAAAIVALLVCAAASLALSVAAAAVHLIAVAAGWIYNVRAKHTWYSVGPWALAFGLLPAVVTLTAPLDRWPAWWMLIAGTALGSGAHFANAIGDLDRDRASGINGLPHRLGRRRSMYATLGLIAAGVVVIAAGSNVGSAAIMVGVAGAVGLPVVAVAMLRSHDRVAFRGVVVLLLLLAVGVVAGGTALY